MRGSTGFTAAALIASALAVAAVPRGVCAQVRAVHGTPPREALPTDAAVDGTDAPAAAPVALPAPLATVIVVELLNTAPMGVRAEQVREAVARELGWTAVAPRSPDADHAGARLRVRFDLARRRVLLEFRDALGHPMRRAAPLALSAREALETIAFLAGNLARDESLDVLAALALPRNARHAGGDTADDPASAEARAHRALDDADDPEARPRSNDDADDDDATHDDDDDDARSNAARRRAAPTPPARVAPVIDPETLAMGRDGYHPPSREPTADTLRRTREGDARRARAVVALGASTGGGLADGRAGWTWNAGGSLRLRGLLVRLDMTHSLLPERGDAAPAFRVWACPLLGVAPSIGALALELGVGVGLLVSSTSIWGSDPAARTDALTNAPAARASVAASLPLAGALEATLRVDAHVGVVNTVVDGLNSYRAVSPQLTALVGIQARWTP